MANAPLREDHVIMTKWEDPHIYWKPHHFGDLDKMRVPADMLWKPDLMIEEMIEKDKAVPNAFITINSNGFVEYVRDLMVVSTCKMQVYKFSFDIQTCNLSLKSIGYPEEELKFQALENSTVVTEWTCQMMKNQFEWLFIGMTVKNKSVPHFYQNQNVVIYTITMRRRSALYIANFLVPILFFFCLDLASFLISHKGGEKLSFKVTVLLAVTVMQLILNDILPASANRIPLIVVYCIGIFGLMMLSLMETILIMHLVEKDNEADKDQILSNDFGDKLEKDSFQNSSRVAGYWTRVSKTINNVFFIFYLIAATVFFLLLRGALIAPSSLHCLSVSDVDLHRGSEQIV
nr:5-hydroxytryptamine receptor 3A-like [Pseudochaenichthys georgianus]